MLFKKSAKSIGIEVHYDDLKKLDKVCDLLDYDYDGTDLQESRIFPERENRVRVEITSKRRKVDARKLDDACHLANFEYGFTVEF